MTREVQVEKEFKVEEDEEIWKDISLEYLHQRKSKAVILKGICEQVTSFMGDMDE